MALRFLWVVVIKWVLADLLCPLGYRSTVMVCDLL